jgi:hypothetical protein
MSNLRFLFPRHSVSVRAEREQAREWLILMLQRDDAPHLQSDERQAQERWIAAARALRA